jgi:hypothetical protein
MSHEPDTPRLLEEKGLFTFRSSAVDEISSFFEMREPTLGLSTDDLRELVLLTAAEFALLPVFDQPPASLLPIEEPLPVERLHARLALAKTDCLYIEHCFEAAAMRQLTLPDVTAFSGDVAKLEALGVSSADPPRELRGVADVVDQLERGHREARDSRAQSIGDSGVVRLQGFLWALKLSLGERGLALDQALEESYGVFQLDMPVGGVIGV